MWKKVGEAAIAVALEESVRNFIPILLPYVWFVILVGITWELVDTKRVHALAGRAYLWSERGKGYKVSSFILAALIGAGIGIVYWLGISKAFAGLKHREQESTSELAQEIVKAMPPLTSQSNGNAAQSVAGNQPQTSTPLHPVPSVVRKPRVVNEKSDQPTAISKSAPQSTPAYPSYEEGSPNAGPEDPQLMRDAALASMQKAELASKITDISRKMREYERSWQWIGPNPPDSPPVGNENTEEYKQQMELYQKEIAEWHKQKDEEPAKFRNRFFQNFSNDLLVIGELERRFPGQVSKSTQCGLLFGGIAFEKGDLLICADHLDDVVRKNLD